MKLGRVLLGLALLAGSGYGVYALVQGMAKTKGPALQNLQEGTYIPNGANPDRPTVTVGIVTDYAGVTYVDDGPLNTDYLPQGWAYTPIVRDWVIR